MAVRSTIDVPHIFLFSMLSQSYYVIIDHGVNAPEYGREVVDGLNATEKNIFQSMETVKLLD